MTQLASDWTIEIDRGPDWIFVKLHGPAEDAAEEKELAESLWSTMQQHMVHRIVIEMDDVPILRSYLLGQLVMLHKRVSVAGGVMRISGLSASNEQALHVSRLSDRFPNYADRADAVMGHRPSQPR